LDPELHPAVPNIVINFLPPMPEGMVMVRTRDGVSGYIPAHRWNEFLDATPGRSSPDIELLATPFLGGFAPDACASCAAPSALLNIQP
jgi:hypothetical protein